MEEQNTATNGPAPIAVYLYAGDQIVENVTMGYFYYQDSLGNTSHVTDAVGNLLERYTYSAFGAPTFYNAAGAVIYNTAGISVSALGIRHLFQGQLWTQETGLNDYRNRVELPTMGVFLQPDPLGFKGDAANIYRFCNNNAVNRTDPTGLVSNPNDILKPNLTMFGQGDWARLGSAFTNGDLQSMVRNYLGQLQSAVDSYVNKANEASQKAGGSVTWSADYTNWLKDGKAFQNPRDVATTDFCTETGVSRKENGTVAGFNVNLHIDINWNNDRSGSFASAFRTDIFGPFDKTGEIEHARDALRALARPYGELRPP
jgi:RHS repeat-associated protein